MPTRTVSRFHPVKLSRFSGENIWGHRSMLPQHEWLAGVVKNYKIQPVGFQQLLAMVKREGCARMYRPRTVLGVRASILVHARLHVPLER